MPSLAATGIRLMLSALAFLPILVTMPAGNWLATKLSRQAFDQVLLGLLAVTAIKLVRDSLF